nr:hypothetical protein CFP56_57150 [Quercus suber]
MNDTETGFSMGSYEACSYDGRDLLDCSHFPGLEDNSCAIGNNDGERQKFHEPLNDENGNKVNTPERKSYQNAVSELKAYSSSVPFAFHSLDEENKRANLPDDDTVSSSNQGELLLWVNDYKCSLCGIELPRCFVEERQEHFDIHRAERLQKEESRCDIRMLRHRLEQIEIRVVARWGVVQIKASPPQLRAHLFVDHLCEQEREKEGWVRTRAVTLQKYICSSEDILKYASKLLKAELPVSLRLIGLRLSQFNTDKAVAPADPTQKTLTNFLISGDASRESMVDSSSMGSIVNDHHFMNDTETGFSMGSHEACSCGGRDLLDRSHFPDLEDNNCAIGNNDGEMHKFHEPLNDENGSKVNTPERKSYQNAVSELKADSSSVPFAFCSLDEENKRANLPDDDTVSSSNQGELLLWVNDYKCSLCGIELPPCFVEERQEHFDFHLAERLQKEESRCDTRMLRHRVSPKDNIASQRKRKKQRASPKDKGHIPIDLFFVKSSQNF